MAITPQSRYRDQDDDLSSDDSFDWSSDSTPKTRRNTIRKAATTATTGKTSLAKGSIKKAKKAKKAGRKPLEPVAVLPSDPKLKRKAQNRAAQRAFRERKEQFVNELQDQMRELQQAKEKREKELSAENARLKRENEKLKEENYLLKDAQFTFQISAEKGQAVDEEAENRIKSTPIPLVSPPNTDDQTMLSSPDLDSQSQADKSLFSCGCEDSSKCGELSDYQGGSTSDSAHSMPETSFATAAETKEPEFTFNTTTSQNSFSLLHGQEAPFLTPSSNAADFLIQSEPLPALFGTEMDFFGAPDLASYEENSELDAYFSEQMQALVDQEDLLKCAPENEKPCKKKVLGMLRRSRGANRSIAQINQDVKSYCPDFNLDQLCEDLKKKITFEPHHTLTEDDVDLYIECIQRHT